VIAFQRASANSSSKPASLSMIPPSTKRNVLSKVPTTMAKASSLLTLIIPFLKTFIHELHQGVFGEVLKVLYLFSPQIVEQVYELEGLWIFKAKVQECFYKLEKPVFY
jgi:hypothetical protein